MGKGGKGKGGKGYIWSTAGTPDTGTRIYRDPEKPVSREGVVVDKASNEADESVVKIDEKNGGAMKTSDSCQVSEVVKPGTGDMVAKQDVSTRCQAPKITTSATPSTTDGSSTSGTYPSRCPKLVTRVAPFDPAAVDIPIDLDDALQLELRKCDGPLYTHMIEYLSKRINSPSSLRLGWRKSLKESDEEVNDNDSLVSDCSDYGPNHGKMPTTELGLGLHEVLHEFEDENKRTIYVLYQTLGMPVGGYGSACLYTSLILLMKEEKSRKHTRGLLEEFLGTVWRLSTKVNKSEVAIWRFDIKDSFWSKVAARKPRDLSLVVLEKEMKKLIIEDISWFLRRDTCDFYAQHGIPYHRAYLFYGAPGAGKTSTIFALAGEFERNLCFLQASVQMTDDSFRLAIGQAPPKSIIVMEDVDALFTVHRESNTNHSLSFSGFLNAIDGLASSDDVIFVLTTNHPERLDPALLRPGRVDVRVEFKAPNMEMAKEYFLTYYPDADNFALQFAKNTSREHSQVSMAQMQHYFLFCHRHQYGAEKAAQEVTTFPWTTPVGREVNNMMY